MAGSSSFSNGSLPNFFDRAAHPETAPGTVTGSQPSSGIFLSPSNFDADRARGARPEALRPWSLRPSQTRAKLSEPTALLTGSRTGMHAAVATAASTALPPWRRTCKPAWAASGWVVATQLRANTGERREGYGNSEVKGEGMAPL